MKISTLLLAALMTASTSAAFAEGGAERSREFWDTFKVSQQQLHGNAEQRLAAEKAKKDTPISDTRRAQEQTPKA